MKLKIIKIRKYIKIFFWHIFFASEHARCENKTEESCHKKKEIALHAKREIDMIGAKRIFSKLGQREYCLGDKNGGR